MKRQYFHVFLIPFAFILHLYAQNMNKVDYQNILVSLAVSIGLSGLLYLIFYGISRSWGKAAVITSIFFILFLNHNSITRLTKALIERINNNLEVPATLPHYSAFFLITTFILILWKIINQKEEPRTLNRLIGFYAIGMVGITFGIMLFPLVGRLTNANYQPQDNFAETWQIRLKNETDLLENQGQLPDIYYIILDGYGRLDVLKEFYGFDNQQFQKSLTDMGFLIANDSLSNYKATALSISSSLNMDYINWISTQTGNEDDYIPVFNIIEHNRVFEQLQRLGYRTNTFATGFAATEIETVDQVFRPSLYPNEFETLLIYETPIGLLWNSKLHDIHRERIEFTLRNLASAGNQPGPDVTFAHIVSPHPPFVFGANGESITPNRPYTIFDGSDFLEMGSIEEYRTGYINQLKYLNQVVLETLREILQNSNTPPIIIIQGDHGPGLQLNHEVLEESNLFERYPILNAFYIPCATNDDIPDDITPVNSFRYVFNACFHAGLPYLENRQYFSPNAIPFRITDVTEQITQNK